jgi:hypothetical protein
VRIHVSKLPSSLLEQNPKLMFGSKCMVFAYMCVDCWVRTYKFLQE